MFGWNYCGEFVALKLFNIFSLIKWKWCRNRWIALKLSQKKFVEGFFWQFLSPSLFVSTFCKENLRWVLIFKIFEKISPQSKFNILNKIQFLFENSPSMSLALFCLKLYIKSSKKINSDPWQKIFSSFPISKFICNT